MAASNRSGAGSPSHDLAAASRLFPKRAREIQAQEGLPGPPMNPWGHPPTSGNSTPLRENIPESPTDGFPDFLPPVNTETLPSSRRTRAGTLPSRFAPSGISSSTLGAPPGLPNIGSRASPSHSPFKSPSPAALEQADPLSSSSALLSRLRAGSMPQRSLLKPASGTSSPFGPSVFSSWGSIGRDRASTLASIASVPSNGPSSPAQSQYSKEGQIDSDVQMRTLDYLGLAETPQQTQAQLATPYISNLAEFAKQASRIRSYSVNNQDKYEEDDTESYPNVDPRILAMQLQNEINATNAALQRNMNLQAAMRQASSTRPRASTAGVLDAPGSRALRSLYAGPSQLENSMTTDELAHDASTFDNLASGMAGVGIGRSNSRNNGLLNADDASSDGPTNALWLGSIPTSTTTSTLTELFKQFGTITSARVLTHKNCGFVNFEHKEHAHNARQSLNGKEIFPGAGPIKINFAKSISGSNTPGHDGPFPSPSPDPFRKGVAGSLGAVHPLQEQANGMSGSAEGVSAVLVIPALRDMSSKIMDIVKQFGATDDDSYRISMALTSAIQYTGYAVEIPAIKEPTHTRTHDAPRLRDIRKRIDNQSLSLPEIEHIAVEMLPEIVELSSDYLGNTVIQKLFEHCSDALRDDMLTELAPHLAEIGVHKNGTWAAQKIIEVCKTPSQMRMIVTHLKPYTVPLFLDQYGNYVLQGCLKFGAPYNDFIFEIMIGKTWEIAQGRYGARAMRACLESHHATKDQQRLLAAVIALHSVQLATNPNGALLLTWFLDTCTFPQRRTVLAPQLAPYLVQLCTHKVAYLTVLKVINQKAEPEARDSVLQAMFFTENDQILEAILSDHTCGATLIFKVLTTPFLDESVRPEVVENVKTVLLRIKAQANQGYKRLMDEVGISTRGAGSRDHSMHSERQRSTSRHAIGQHQQGRDSQNTLTQPQPGHFQGSSNGQQYPKNAYDHSNLAGSVRNDAVDPMMTSQFPAFNAQSFIYNGGNPAMTPMNLQQLQYQQQAMMQRGATAPMPQYYPQIQTGFGGFPGQSPAMDQFRQQNMVNGSPVPPQSPFTVPSYPMAMGMPAAYGYGGLNGLPQDMGYVQNNNRRQGRGGNQSQRIASNGRQY